MTNTRDKFSGGGGDLAPSPRSPASSEDGKETQKTASVPIENCLTVGVQSIQVRTKKEQHKGMLICFAKDLAVLVGAGGATPWSKGHDDRWPFDSWFLARKGGKQVSIYPQIKSDALALVIADEGGGLVFWDGKEVHWQQEE